MKYIIVDQRNERVIAKRDTHEEIIKALNTLFKEERMVDHTGKVILRYIIGTTAA